MYLRFILSVLTCSLFLTKPLFANPEDRVHVIFAVDQSDSMFDYGNPRWIAATRTAFNTYFNEYQPRCQKLTVDYLAWGEKVEIPIQQELHTQDDGRLFSKIVTHQTRLRIGNTDPYSGIMAATLLVENGYDRTVIIYITDANGFSEKKLTNFKETLRTDVEFIGIALTNSNTYEYLKEFVIPDDGTILRGRTQEELTTTFKEVMDEIGYDHCITG